MTTGRFIALEGIDGAGTTTQLERLAAHFGDRLHPTREPSTGPIGREIRRHLAGPVEGLQLDPAALALLFAADRIDHLRREIEPAIARGVHVVSDRYYLSSLAYQTIDVSRDHVERWNAFATRPDLTIFVEVPVDVAEARRSKRGGPAEIFEQRALQERIAKAYRGEVDRIAYEGQLVALIDGTADVDTVFGHVLSVVQSCIDRAARRDS